MRKAAIAGFSDAVISAYRGWYALVEKESGWESAKWVLINDLSGSTVKPRFFGNRAEVRRTLEELRDAAPDEKSAHRLQQSIYYLEQKPGERVTMEGVLRRGIPWKPIGDSVLERLRTEFEALQRDLIDAGTLTRDESQSRYGG